jgi:hypothetical protein
MKRNLMGVLMTPFLFVSTVHADNVSITPGTGNLGFNPPVTVVPEPNTAVLILLGILILCLISAWVDLRTVKKRGRRR